MIIFIVLRSYNCSLGKVTEEERDRINALKNKSVPCTINNPVGHR